MAENTIDTLELKIQSDADKATKALDGLAKTLSNLKKGMGGFNTTEFSQVTNNAVKMAKAFSEAFAPLQKLTKEAHKLTSISLKMDTEDIEHGIAQLRKKFKDIGTDFEFTGNSYELEKAIKTTTLQLDKLFAKEDRLKNIGANINTSGFRGLEYDISLMTKKLDILISKRDELQNVFENIPIQRYDENVPGFEEIQYFEIPEQSLKYNKELMRAVYGEIAEDIRDWSDAVTLLGNNAGQVLNDMQQDLQNTKNSISELPKETSNAGDGLKEAGESVSTGFSEILSSAVKTASSIKKVFEELWSVITKTSSSILKATNTIASGFSLISNISLKTESAILKSSKSIFSAFTGIGRSSSAIKNTSINLKNLFKTALGFGAITGIVSFGKNAIELGSDIAEVENVVDVAFGSMANKAYEFASTATEQFGLSELAAKQYSGTLMSMFNSAGIVKSKAADMSIALAGLAGDLASFYNIDTDTAFKKLQSGIAGQVQPLRSLGIDLTNATLQEYALSRGITTQVSAMTQAEKEMLRYEYIMSVTAQQQGDFARTSGSWANQVRLLALNFQSLSSVIGQGLIAAILPAIQVLNALLGKLMQVAEAFRNFMYTLMGKKVQGSSSGIVDEYAGLGDAVSNMEDLGDAETGAADAAKDLKKALSVLPFDELNQLADSATDTGDGLSNAGSGAAGALDNIGFGGLDDAIRDLAETDTTPISEWAKRIREAFLAGDWEGLGKEIADGLNKGMKYVYDAINWKKVGPKITKFTNAFTRSFNSLVDNLDFDLMGRVIGTGINTLVNTFNQLIGPGGINFRNIGRKLSEGLRGAIDEINWKNLGNLLGNYFMISWKMLDGFITDMSRKSDAGLTGWQELGTAVGTAINGIFDRINFDVIGSVLANGLNGAFSAIFTAIDTIEWNDIADKLSHGFNKMVNEIEWEEIGHGFGESFNTIIEALDRLVTGISWANLGWKIADGLIEAIETINWTELGNLLGDGFMIAWDMLGGFLTNMSQKRNSGLTGWEELGISIADTVEGFFDEIDFVKIADALTEGINGAFSSLQSFTSTFDWEELTNNIKDGIAEFLKDMDWEENGAALGQFLSDLCSAIKDIMTVDTFREIGDGIATFLGQLPWGEILSTAASTLINAFAGLLEGIWSNDDISLLEKGISTGFLLVEAGNITGIGTLAGKVVEKLAEKFIEEKNTTKLAEKIGEVITSGASGASDALGDLGNAASGASGGFSNLSTALGPLVGEAGLIVGVGVAATAAVSGLLSFIETMQGGNGVASEFGASMDSYYNILTEKGWIASDTAEEIWKLKESLESGDMTSEQMRDATKQLITELGNSGITADQARYAFDLLRSQYQMSDEMAQYFTESIDEMNDSLSESSVTIPNTKEAYDTLYGSLGSLTNQLGLAANTIPTLDNAFRNSDGSAKTAQEAYESLIDMLDKMGVNTEEAARIISELIPGATLEVKKSVDTNIVGATNTIESSMESAEKTVSETTSGMKSDAESNLSDIQGTAESAFGAIDDTTVLKWGNSAREVQVNLRAMKVAASTELANMTETVRSYSQSMYNIMTEKFGYLRDEIASIITEMNSNMESVFDSMFMDMSNSTRQSSESILNEFANLSSKIRRSVEGTKSTVNNSFNAMFSEIQISTNQSLNEIANMFSSLPDRIGGGMNDSMYSYGRNAAQSFANGMRSVHIPTLEFYIASWKTHDLGNGGRTSTPVFKPNWYKVGGLFNGASVIGVGEAGKEAVLPLENKRTMSMIANSIISNAGEIGLSEEALSNAVARGVAMAMMNSQGNSGMPEYIQNSIYLDGDVMARAVTKAQRDRDGRFNPSPQFGY